MEQFLDIIVDVEVIDKHETGGASTNMEVLGLQRILERIAGNIVTSELVTDECLINGLIFHSGLILSKVDLPTHGKILAKFYNTFQLPDHGNNCG